jgi:amino acid transporter
LIIGLLALLFDLDQLIEMVSIGTLNAYSVVAICTIILRYRPKLFADKSENVQLDVIGGETRIEVKSSIRSLFSFEGSFFMHSECTDATSKRVNILIFIAGNHLYIN